MEKQERLREQVKKLAEEGLTVAFSGGADSSLLLKLACGSGKPVQAVLLRSQLMPGEDRDVAERVAAECGAALTVLDVDVRPVPEIMGNDRRRCYFCKKTMFETLLRWSRARGIPNVADGTNADDLTVYRPGLRALRELSIRSPLAECGMTKAEVRAMAAAEGLSVASRPSAPCMATRLPYGAKLDFAVLGRLEKGEQALRAMGFPVCRLRLHGDVLRLELPPEQFPALLARRTEIAALLRETGASYLTLDLLGFRSGSMDIGVKNDG